MSASSPLGIYNETINFLGKAITLRSSHGADVTTIDATGIRDSVVTCRNGEGHDTVLDGFTVTGGRGWYTKFMFTIGGGMFNYYSSPTVTDCLFIRNFAESGGGMFNYSASPRVMNCTMSGNGAYGGGGIQNSKGSGPSLTNCIFWGNTPDEISGSSALIAFSDVQGGLPIGAVDGGGNIAVDPMFTRETQTTFLVTCDYGPARRASTPAIRHSCRSPAQLTSTGTRECCAGAWTWERVNSASGITTAIRRSNSKTSRHGKGA